MMGGSRGSADPRLAGLGDAIAMLRLLADRDGLSKTIKELEEAHKAIADDLVKQGTEADRKVAAAEEAQKALKERTQALDIRETALADSEQKLKQRAADLAKQEAGVEESKTALSDAIANLNTRSDAYDQAHTDRMGKLEIEHQQRSKKLEDVTADLQRWKMDLDHRDAMVKAAEDAVTERSVAVARQEQAAAEALEAAQKLRAEYEEKVAALKSLMAA